MQKKKGAIEISILQRKNTGCNLHVDEILKSIVVKVTHNLASQAPLQMQISNKELASYPRFTCNYVLAAKSFVFDHSVSKKISKSSCCCHRT